MTRYIKSGTVNTIQEVNSELEKIATAQTEFLTRNGETPNTMSAPLDMNGNRIINLPSPVSLQEPLRLQDLESFNKITGDIILNSEIKVFPSISAMKNAPLIVGNTVLCKRYYADGDLAEGLLFEIVETASVDGYIDHQNTNGTFAIKIRNLKFDGTPVYKRKPSKNDFIKSKTLPAELEQIKLGDGRLSVGTNATDLVYRTARNSQGGTDGLRQVTARFAVPITDLANQVTFTIQLNPAHLAGVVVQGLATDDSTLATITSAYFPLTDNGSGNYTFGPWTPSGGKDYYGFEVQLTPVDTTNNATLHDEFFVIQDMTIVQNSNNLLAQTEVQGSTTWAQQILTSLPLAFSRQVLPSNIPNNVYVTHTQNISGASYRYAYASPTGLATNNGSKFSEFSIEKASEVFNSGSLSLLILKSGTYTFAGVKPRNIFQLTSSHTVLCEDGEALIDAGLDILFSSMTATSLHYNVAYAEVNNYNQATIATGSTTPKLMLATLNETLIEVASEALTETTDWSFYWNNATKTFSVRFDGTQTDDVIVPEAGVLFVGDNIGYFGCANIYMSGVQAHFLDIDIGDYYETYNTGARFGNAAGDIYDIDDIDGVQVDDYSKKARNDVYNYHGSGHTDLFDCVAEYCNDDGVSHHDNCTGFIQGGRFDFNGKGGVIPAFGATVTCVDVQANGNVGGTGNSSDFNYGGFVSISSDVDAFLTTLTCYNCTAENNYAGFLSTGGKSKLAALYSSVAGNTRADYVNETWGSNSNAGLISVEGSGTFAGIDGSKVNV